MELTYAVAVSLIIGMLTLFYFSRIAFPNLWNRFIGGNTESSQVVSQGDVLDSVLLESAGLTNINMRFTKGTRIIVKGNPYFIEGQLQLTSAELVSDFSTFQNEMSGDNNLEVGEFNGNSTTFSKSKRKS